LDSRKYATETGEKIMSLKGDRIHLDSRISYFMNHVANRGGIVVVATAGSGVAMDSSLQVVEYASTSSGKVPVGVLMSEVVNLDLTRQRLNEHKEEVQVQGKVTIWTKCQVTTNVLTSGITVVAGDKAYLGIQGQITNINTGAVASPLLGRFETKKDENGYATVSIDLS
jgi:hypothetical protein